MERKLIDYLPYVIRDYAEFQGIMGSEQPEIERAWDSVDDLFDNQFISTAGNMGLSRWEKILEITPKGTDTLEDRRFRILTRINEELPYTHRWLTNWLRSQCGADNPAPVVDGYTLWVSLPSGVDYMNILDELRQRIPANLVIAPHIRLAEATSKLFVGSTIRLSIKQTITVLAEGDNGLTAFTDDSGAVLTDENGKILYMEAML